MYVSPNKAVKTAGGRGAVLVVRDGAVAAIERLPPGEAPYYLFPGGRVEPGETAAEAEDGA